MIMYSGKLLVSEGDRLFFRINGTVDRNAEQSLLQHLPSDCWLLTAACAACLTSHEYDSCIAPLISQEDMATRITEYLSKIPVVTLGLITLNCVVYCIIFLSSVSINRVAISASQVLDGEYFRVVTSVFVHGGILHIFFNMSTLLDLGWHLESQFGSMKFAFLSIWSILTTGLLYVLLSW